MKRRPLRLFVGYREQPLAREPNEGWWAAAKAAADVITDPAHLRGARADLAGASAYVWTQTGNTFFTLPIAGSDLAAGALRLRLVTKWARLKDGDKYYLQNHPSFIDRPGEWAVQERGGEFQLFFRPASEADLAAAQVMWESGAGVSLRGVRHVRVVGLDILGWKRCGLEAVRCKDVKILRCRIAMNGHTGLILRNVEDGEAAGDLIAANGLVGASVLYSNRIRIAENEIAFNRMDGLIIAWKTRDVAVERNYIHHHLWWGHPDNIQMYRGVENVRFVDNLLLAGGQTVMLEQCRRLTFEGDMLVGCAAYMLIFGHKNASDARVAHCTLAYPGYGCLSLTASGYRVTDNVFVTGHAGYFYSIRGVQDFQAARNLYWAGPRAVAGVASDRGWHRTYAAFREANPDVDAGSKYADPGFVNAPLAFAVLDARRLTACTRSRAVLRGGAGLFQIGDYIEFNFDGCPRRVAACDQNSITFEPPLPAAPAKAWLVANWGANQDFALDLRLKSALEKNADAPGSRISIPAFRRGDFNGDGRRDAPAYPDDWGRDARTPPTAAR